MTENMAVYVEESTRDQHNSKLWFKFCSGRITASIMKSVCRTDAANPSQNLIKQICYPQLFKFSSRQTDWGCAHERAGRNCYSEVKMKESHSNFSVCDVGLVINPKWPYLGATPDGKVSCTCCGKGIIEIKCPYCHKESTIDNATQDKNFCLKKDSSGNIWIIRMPTIFKSRHSYSLQI